MTDVIENITFMRCPPTALVKARAACALAEPQVISTWVPTSRRRWLVQVNVPVKLSGEDVCPGMRKGGFINFIRRTVPCVSTGAAVPESFTADLSALEIGGKMTLGGLALPEGVALRDVDHSLPVVKIMGRSSRASAADVRHSLLDAASEALLHKLLCCLSLERILRRLQADAEAAETAAASAASAASATPVAGAKTPAAGAADPKAPAAAKAAPAAAKAAPAPKK